MAVIALTIALLGVLGTIFALWRLLAAAKSGASRELTLGWLALMLASAALSMLLLRAV